MSKDTAHQYLLHVKDRFRRDPEEKVKSVLKGIENIMDWSNLQDKGYHLDEALILSPLGREDG